MVRLAVRISLRLSSATGFGDGVSTALPAPEAVETDFLA